MKFEDRINRKYKRIILISEFGSELPICVRFIEKVRDVKFPIRNLNSRVFFKSGGCHDFQDKKEVIEKLIEMATTQKHELREKRLNSILNKLS